MGNKSLKIRRGIFSFPVIRPFLRDSKILPRKLMQKGNLLLLFVLAPTLLLGGCRSSQVTDPAFFKLLEEADNSIAEARLSGADQKCPKEFQKVLSLRKGASECLYDCEKGNSEILARATIRRAKALCPSPVSKKRKRS